MPRKSKLEQRPIYVGKRYDSDLSYDEWPVERQMLSYVSYGAEKVEWVDNEPFEDTLVYDSFERGRSAVTFWWKSLRDGTFYPMFAVDMDAVLRSCGVSVGGIIAGRFMARKQGANYGLLRVVEP